MQPATLTMRRPPARVEARSRPAAWIPRAPAAAADGFGGGAALRVEVGGLEVASLACEGTLAGVVVRGAAGRNGVGVGRLTTPDGASLRWRAPGSTLAGPAVPTPTAGEYLLEDGSDRDRWLRVAVWPDHLPNAGGAADVRLRDVYGNAIGGDDVSAAEALAGDVATVALTVANRSSGDLEDVRAWLGPDADGLELSDDGVAWVTPDSEAHVDALLLGTLAAGATTTIYTRRTIAAAAASAAAVLRRVEFSWYGL